MFFIENFLGTLVLYDAQALRSGIYLDPFTLQLLKGIYIDILYFKGNQIGLFAKLVYSIEVHQVTLKKSMTAKASGRLPTGIKHDSANIIFEGLTKEHLSQLPPTEDP